MIKKQQNWIYTNLYHQKQFYDLCHFQENWQINFSYLPLVKKLFLFNN